MGGNPALGGGFAGMGTRDDAGDAHTCPTHQVLDVAYVALDRLAVDGHLLLEQHGDLAGAIARAGCVQLADPHPAGGAGCAPLDGQLF